MDINAHNPSYVLHEGDETSIDIKDSRITCALPRRGLLMV